MFAVIASNIHWKITPNGYLASAIGAALAFGATAAINKLLLWSRQKRGASAGQ
ncbi:hypothetical protein AB7M46_007647 [Bradyrhizobium elkanii]